MTARFVPVRCAAAATMLIALAVGMPSATAQDPPLPVPAPPMPQDCRAAPDDGRAQQPDDETGDLTTGALADCNGVLAPPPTGDGEMVTPAPPVGRTPVIRPGEIAPDVEPEPASPD